MDKPTDKHQSYNAYKDEVWSALFEASGLNPLLPEGVYNYKGKLYNKRHVLPVGKNYHKKVKITKGDKIEAIENLLKVDISELESGLHKFVHHLSSSQLLCFMMFSKLTDKSEESCDRMAKPELVKLLSRLGIQISEGAVCQFEYSDGQKWNAEDENTSFDFHIKDDKNNREIFFEIKFTECGFGKAKNDEKHRLKIDSLYIPWLDRVKNSNPSLLKVWHIKVADWICNYQILRNLIRVNGTNKICVFITDKHNPSTERDWVEFCKQFGPNNAMVRHITWQEIKGHLIEILRETDLPFQFKCFNETPAFI